MLCVSGPGLHSLDHLLPLANPSGLFFGLTAMTFALLIATPIVLTQTTPGQAGGPAQSIETWTARLARSKPGALCRCGEAKPPGQAPKPADSTQRPRHCNKQDQPLGRCFPGRTGKFGESLPDQR